MYKFIFYDVDNNELGSFYINDCFTKLQALNKLCFDIHEIQDLFDFVSKAARIDIVCNEV